MSRSRLRPVNTMPPEVVAEYGKKRYRVVIHIEEMNKDAARDVAWAILSGEAKADRPDEFTIREVTA